MRQISWKRIRGVGPLYGLVGDWCIATIVPADKTNSRYLYELFFYEIPGPLAKKPLKGAVGSAKTIDKAQKKIQELFDRLMEKSVTGGT